MPSQSGSLKLESGHGYPWMGDYVVTICSVLSQNPKYMGGVHSCEHHCKLVLPYSLAPNQKPLPISSFSPATDYCSSRGHHCQHECISTVGDPQCHCRKGYDLLADGRNCCGEAALASCAEGLGLSAYGLLPHSAWPISSSSARPLQWCRPWMRVPMCE